MSLSKHMKSKNNNRFVIYSELFTLEDIQVKRHFAGFGIFFTHLLIESFIINLTKHELPSLKENMIPHLMTTYL